MVTDYCGLNGDVDLESARRTAQAYVYSGNWNPSVNPTNAPAGAIFMGNGVDPDTGEVTRGKLWQKQDAGCSTNWTQMTPGTNGSAVINVDPVNGDDATGKPYKTLTAALAAAAVLAGPATGDCTPKFPRPVVNMQPGRYVGNFLLPFNVSLFGYGFDNTQIIGNLSYVGAAGEAGRSDITNVAISGNFNVDTSLACNTNLRFINSRCSLVYDGGDVNTAFNNFLCHASVFQDVTVIDGNVQMYNNQGIFGNTVVQNGRPGSFPNLNVSAGLIQGAFSAIGQAYVTLRGVINTSSFAGTLSGGIAPNLDADMGSMPVAITGNWVLIQGGFTTRLVTAAASPVTVGVESAILADAAAGPIVINLPLAARRLNMPLTVKKTDATANAVTLTPAGGNTVDGGGALAMTTSKQARQLLSNQTTDYNIIAGYL